MKKQILILTIEIIFLLLFGIFFVHADATCQALGDVNIICLNGNCNYGINEKLSNISVNVKPTVGNNSNLEVIVSICKLNTVCSTSTETIKRFDSVFTDKNGQVILNNLDISSINTKSGDYSIISYVKAINITATNIIHIMPTLKVTLSCDSKSYAVGREVKCTAAVEDRDKIGTLITANPNVIVKQGNTEIANTVSTESGKYIIKFITTSTPGSIDIMFTADKNSYISDTSIYSISITGLVRTQVFYVDNKKYPEDYVGAPLNVGSHSLKFNVLESGQAVDILSITSNIKTPTGEQTDLVFIQSGSDWVATTNKIQTPGQTYIVSGTIKFVDVNKDDIPFEYNLITGASGVIDRTTFNWTIVFWIVGIIVFIIIILVIIGFVFRRKK